MHETPPTHRALVLFSTLVRTTGEERGPPRGTEPVARFSRLLEVEKRISDARDAALAAWENYSDKVPTCPSTVCT